MLAARVPGLRLTGVDLSEPMLQKARKGAEEAGVADRLDFRLGDAKSLPFSERSFDLVLCNSLLHHLPDPLALFNEISRVARPGGAVLLRDLRRPSRLEFPLHAGWFGRRYSGVMRQLYRDSLLRRLHPNRTRRSAAPLQVGRRPGLPDRPDPHRHPAGGGLRSLGLRSLDLAYVMTYAHTLGGEP